MAAKKGKARKESSAGAGTLLWIAIKGLIAVGLVGLVIAGIVWIGGLAGEKVAVRERYAISVMDIACEAPPGRDRAAFLTEVRYLGNLPETVRSVDPATKDRLTAAFRKHPWVDEVQEITVGVDSIIRVELKFRRPVLVVVTAGETEPRVVDRTGVLLPSVPDPDALPRLLGKHLPPTRPAGEVWADPEIRKAAELADIYKPRTLERIDRGWRLTQPDGKVFVVGL